MHRPSGCELALTPPFHAQVDPDLESAGVKQGMLFAQLWHGEDEAGDGEDLSQLTVQEIVSTYISPRNPRLRATASGSGRGSHPACMWPGHRTGGLRALPCLRIKAAGRPITIQCPAPSPPYPSPTGLHSGDSSGHLMPDFIVQRSNAF